MVTPPTENFRSAEHQPRTPVPDATILHLHQQGWSQREIADQCGIRQAVVWRRLQRLRRKGLLDAHADTVLANANLSAAAEETDTMGYPVETAHDDDHYSGFLRTEGDAASGDTPAMVLAPPRPAVQQAVAKLVRIGQDMQLARGLALSTAHQWGQEIVNLVQVIAVTP